MAFEVAVDTAARWARSTSRVLAKGQPGWASDALILKIGDGVRRWSSLPSVAGAGSVAYNPDGVPYAGSNVPANRLITETSLALAVAAATAGVVAKGSQTVNVKDKGAKGDGVTDDTAAIQTALDAGGDILIPAGTYLCGALFYVAGSRIHGQGTIKHKATGGAVGNFPRAVLGPKVQPTYKAPDSVGRVVVTALTSDVTVDGITLDGNGVHVYGLQAVAVDNFTARNMKIKNCAGGLDLRALRYSRFSDLELSNISEDGVSVTDQNFSAGISTRIKFEDVIVVDSQTANGLGSSSMNAFEMDDGPTFVEFIRCKAINSRGCGFEVHVHTAEYSLSDISFVDCVAQDCRPNVGDDRQVAGFMIGQCPAGATLGRIRFINCTSVGSPNAFARIPGAETGTVTTVTIQGGYWKSLPAEAGRSFLRSSCLYIGKQFDDFKVIGATIAGAVDGFGIYTYASGAGSLTLSDVTIVDSYTPLYLGATGGSVAIRGGRITPGAFTSTASTVCVYILTDDLTIEGAKLIVDSTRYTSGMVRMVGVDYASVSMSIRNLAGSAVGNAIVIQDSGPTVFSGCVITGFAVAVFLSGTVLSIVSTGNNFKGTTGKYNSTPAALIDSGNAV